MTQSKDLVFNAAHAAIFLDLLEERGVDRSDVLRGAHLNSSALQDLDQFITFSQYRTILQNGARLSEDPLLGLHFGQRLNITGHGELGIALISCKNYYELLRLSSRYLRIIAPFTRMEVIETEERVELRQDFTVPVGDMGAYLVDIAFGIYSSIAEAIFHSPLDSLHLYCKYVSPVHADLYSSELPYDISWNHPWNGLSISKELAFQKSVMANPTTVRHYEERLTDLMNRTHKQSETILPKIRKIISAEPGIIQALEDVARGFEGVERCYAIQAGREIRVLVRPEEVDDARAAVLARDIAKRVEETLAYPGQIRIVVIRESRSVEVAS